MPIMTSKKLTINGYENVVILKQKRLDFIKYKKRILTFPVL